MDLVLNFEQTVRHGNTLRSAMPQFPGLPDRISKDGYFFELVGDARAPEPRVLDGFLYGFLLFAMKHARRFLVRGPISARSMRNAFILQEAWHRWLPAELRIIDIVPDRIIPENAFARTKNARAIAAYSGGVDATFLALRHARRELGDSSFKLDTVVTVHGFDIPLGNEAVFSGLLRRTDPLLKELGLARRVMRTNVRSFELQHWEQSFGLQVACALHQLSHDFEYGMMASGVPYNHMVDGWGSTPATDYLFSGDDLEIVHEGAGFYRTEKVAHIKDTPTAAAGLNVCWENPGRDGNCGRCEKCLRTRLNFLAAGVPEPACFVGPLPQGAAEAIEIRNKVVLVEMMTIVEFAEKVGIAAAWLDVLRAKIHKAKAAL